MIITQKREGETLTLLPEGRLDTKTAPELEQTLHESLNGVRVLILDMEKVPYISSAGLRVFQYARKQMLEKGSMKVIHVNDDLMEIFDITGFANILTIE